LVRPIDEYVGIDEVLNRVLSAVHPSPGMDRIETQKCFGRVSAADVMAEADFPPYDVSHMDGFAIKSSDLRNASRSHPARLRIIAEVALGEVASGRVKSGEAIRVTTGSPIPEGADTVAQVEMARTIGTSLILDSSQESGMNVYRRGRDVKKGERVLAKGRVVRAQDVGLLLGLGIAKVSVFRKPKVSIIATGNELTDVSRPVDGKTVESHSHVFSALLRAIGCEPFAYGIVRDDPVVLSKKLREALAESDLVMTLGGTSVGMHDLVGSVVSNFHPEVLFHGIRMDRGRVSGVALVDGRPLLLLPGPIQGAMNAFLLLGAPVAQRLSGKSEKGIELVCKLKNDWSARKRFSHFTKVVYVKLDLGSENLASVVEGDTESATVLTKADGYTVVGESVTRMKKASKIRVRLFPGFSPV
jgi:molybdenum cofactor synthesis domain-containing protein